ncbi:MAG: ATP-binding protein, partial [Gaiellales bacterium]
IASAVAVAVAVVLASIGVYFIVRDQLRDEVDRSLEERAAGLTSRQERRGPNRGSPGVDVIRRVLRQAPPPRLGRAAGFTQLVDSGGETLQVSGDAPTLPVGERTLKVAGGLDSSFYADATVEGEHVRVLTVPLFEGVALQVALPLDEVDDVLADLRLILVFVSLGGVVLAGALGLIVARTALAPVRRLTQTTERIAQTQDLSQRIEATGRDEVSRLATTFNTMLAALEESQRAQQQLVADASHELRTPLTSLRTNIELLARDDHLDGAERDEMLGDVTIQLEELTTLVADVVELARGNELDETRETVRLRELVDEAVERARRHAPGVTFVTDLDESVVVGVRAQIDRAVANLLDNAARWSPPGSTVEVTLRGYAISVRDHGPGIPDEDLPHVFDRFYRSPGARKLPGSGLGLAIVRKVAEGHGGAATAEPAEGGGALLRLRLQREG